MNQVITKATAEVAPVLDSDELSSVDGRSYGEFDVILSTADRDRDGDELRADEWKQPLPDHITFDSDHGMSVSSTVGSGQPFLNGAGQLQVRGTYASTEHAQNVRTLVNEGHIRTVSVAFATNKGNKNARPERELLNGAFVAVPANPNALVVSSKAAAKRYPVDTADDVLRSAFKFLRDIAEHSTEDGQEIRRKICAAAENLGVKADPNFDKPCGDVSYAESDHIDDNSPDDTKSNKSAAPNDHIQQVHDIAVKLGSRCYPNEFMPQFNPGTQEGANKSQTSPKSDGEAAPTAEQAAGTAEQAADSAREDWTAKARDLVKSLRENIA